jgi:hypothetical protein
VSAADGSYQFLFPTDAARSGSRERTFTRAGVKGRAQVNYCILKDNTTLQMSAISLSGAALKGLKIGDVYNIIIDAEKDAGATVSEPTEVMVGTLKGREYSATTARGARRMILVVVKGRVYQLSVEAADKDKTQGEVPDTFLKSVVFTAKPATKEIARDAPPAKPDEPKKGDASEVKWTLDLDEMKVPNTPVSGRLRGKEFKPDKVTLQVGFLTFRQGKEFFADAEVKLSLFLKFGESVENKTYEIPALDTVRVGIPHISAATKEPSDRLPKTELFSSKYALKLSFGKAEGGMIPGKIYLSVNDTGKTVLAGTFSVKAE